MTILTLKSFMKKFTLKHDTMTESHLKKVYYYSSYHRHSKLPTIKGFVAAWEGLIGYDF